MKATGYEPGKTVVGDDHCDNPTTVTAVTVVSNRRKYLPMLISRYFEHCDSKNGLKAVTVVPKLPTTVTDDQTTVTHHHGGSVTVLLPVTEFYWRRLRMSKRKIRAVWLTVERVAELMNCSTRTVWRYVKRTSMMVHKEQIKQGSSKIMKSFLLTDPEIYAREMADCESRGRIPDEFIETGIEVDGRLLNSALVYKYRNATAEDGDYYAAL
ncbi:MAG TPA: helix-turn-helix domain-containing protein [Candidatus Cloacimonadota bacterium]|nr:helix-turn-helix domain-containing protein [Candidatus Cloacimonadota bacterium]